jgi:hypothetical protein
MLTIISITFFYFRELTKLKTLKIDIEKISDGLLTDAKKKIKK